MAVLGFFLWGQFGKGFLNLRKVKEGIVTEAVCASGTVQNCAFDFSPKHFQCLSIASGGKHAYKPAAALVGRNIFQLPQEAGIVGCVISVVVHQVRGVGCVARGMDPWSTLE